MKRYSWAVPAFIWMSATAGDIRCPASIESAVIRAELEQSSGLVREAEQTLRETSSRPEAGLCLDGVISRLGHVLQLLGRFEEAEQIYRRALTLRIERWGPDSAETASSLSDISTAVLQQGRIAEAEELVRRALDTSTALRGADHRDTLAIRNNLGVLLVTTGQYARAQPVLRAVVAGFEKQTPRPMPALAVAYRNLAATHYAQYELEEAARYTRIHLELSEAVKDVPSVAAGTLNLITVTLEQGKSDDAESLVQKALPQFRATGGSDYGRLLVLHAAVMKGLNRYGEAESTLRQGITLLEGGAPTDHYDLTRAVQELAAVLRLQRKKKEARVAERRLKELLAGNEAFLGANGNEVRLGFRVGAISGSRGARE